MAVHGTPDPIHKCNPLFYRIFPLLAAQQGVVLMTPPSTPALQQLHHLDTSSPDFQDRLWDTLYGQEYVRCVPKLKGDDLVWLVDYLDKVRRNLALPHSRLRRL